MSEPAAAAAAAAPGPPADSTRLRRGTLLLSLLMMLLASIGCYRATRSAAVIVASTGGLAGTSVSFTGAVKYAVEVSAAECSDSQRERRAGAVMMVEERPVRKAGGRKRGNV
jgi:hypothetical protein